MSSNLETGFENKSLVVVMINWLYAEDLETLGAANRELRKRLSKFATLQRPSWLEPNPKKESINTQIAKLNNLAAAAQFSPSDTEPWKTCNCRMQYMKDRQQLVNLIHNLSVALKAVSGE